jgi:hypothetical protein
MAFRPAWRETHPLANCLINTAAMAETERSVHESHHLMIYESGNTGCLERGKGGRISHFQHFTNFQTSQIFKPPLKFQGKCNHCFESLFGRQPSFSEVDRSLPRIDLTFPMLPLFEEP